MINVSELPQKSQNHQIKIVYENEGRIDGDAVNLQLKGLVSVHLINAQKPIMIDHWKYYPHAVGPLTSSPKKAQPWFDDRHWPDMKAGDFQHLYRRGLANQTSTWFRGYFTLTKKELQQYHPVLDMQAIFGKATIYINGKKVTTKQGRYTSFAVTLPNNIHAGINTVAVYVNNEKGLGGIYRPAVVRFTNNPVKMNLTVNQGLYGKEVGWTKEDTNPRAFNNSKDIASYKSTNDITWYSMTFNLPSNDDWTIPLAAKIQISGNAQIWINGHLEGRYFVKGPQKKFYLPKPWLNKGENTLMLVVRPAKNGQIPKLQHASIISYRNYVVKHNKVNLRF